MEAYIFKTNINCENSIRTLMVFIDNNPKIRSWSVDTSTVDNLLHIQCLDLGPDDIITLVQKAGFRIEQYPDA
ncbi:MAG: hypothetical protein AAF985_26775 [Bacteroidota bacterium]